MVRKPILDCNVTGMQGAIAMRYSRYGASALLGFVAIVASLISPGAIGAAKSLATECPHNYQVKPGLDSNFPIDGTMRAFVVVPPTNLRKPVPVWVPLTGTVESTDDNLHVARSGTNAQMAEHGFMVIGPVRACANQDPGLRAGACNSPGIDGWNWRPWTEGRAMACAWEPAKSTQRLRHSVRSPIRWPWIWNISDEKPLAAVRPVASIYSR